MLAFKAGLLGLSLIGVAYGALKQFKDDDEEGQAVPKNPKDMSYGEISKLLFGEEGIPLQVYEDVAQKNYDFFTSPSERRAKIFTQMTPKGEPVEKPEPEMALIKVRIQHGSKQSHNMAEWNETDGVLDLYYLNGFEPELVNMKSKRISDNVLQVSLESDLINLLKRKNGPFKLRGLGPASTPLLSLSPLPYRKHAIGHHICKHFVPAISSEFQEDLAAIKEDGILPQDYKYGNVPFSSGMCIHPQRTKEAQSEVVDCEATSNMPLCNVFEKEEGVPVEIKTKSRGTLEGMRVRTFNPYRGAVYTEMFDIFGDRFSGDTEHNILPDKESTDDNKAEESQSPLLKGRAVSRV